MPGRGQLLSALPPGPESAPSNLIGAKGFAVGRRSLGWHGLCAIADATAGSALDGGFPRRNDRLAPLDGFTRADRAGAVPRVRNGG